MTLPVPSQRTWTVGDIVTAAMMNANVRDAVGFLEAPPIALLTQGVSQSIPNSATTAINFDSETVDSYNGHSTTTNTNRYTAQVAGWYLVIGDIAYPNNATGRRELILQTNGSSVTGVEGAVNPSQQTLMQGANLAFLNVGDWVGIASFQTSGGALSLQVTGAAASWMAVLWVHA